MQGSVCYTFRVMRWRHKGIDFSIEFEVLGPFTLASARVPPQGPFVRVRPFSALGRGRDESVTLLKQQIEMEYRRVPEPPPER